MTREPRTVRVPVALPEQGSGAAWLRNFRMSGFALTILVLVILALVVLAPQFKTLVEQRQQIAQLEREVQNARDNLDHIDSEVARWSDPAYIEAQARDRLYYVYPGDVSYLVIDDGGGAPDVTTPQPISDSIQTTRVDWVHSFLASVYTAGLTEATPETLDGATAPAPSEGGEG